MILQLQVLAVTLTLVAQTLSQQFNPYDSGSPRPFPAVIPGAIPLGPLEPRPRPNFRPSARRIQGDEPIPVRTRVKKPFQVRGGRISPIEAEPPVQTVQQLPPQIIASTPVPQRPVSFDPNFSLRPVTEEIVIESDQGQTLSPTLPPVAVTQRLSSTAFRTPKPPVFRPTSAFAPTPIQDEEEFIPAKTYKQPQPALNEVSQLPPQRVPQRKSQYPRLEQSVRQSTPKVPQFEKPIKPSADRNDIDRAGVRERKPVAQILRRYREDNPDGSITWGFENDDGSFKEETIGVDCITRGKYGYIDPDGNRREYSYTSGIACNRKEQDEEESSAHGYIDYTNNKYIMPNGDAIDLSNMVKNRARKPVNKYS